MMRIVGVMVVFPHNGALLVVLDGLQVVMTGTEVYDREEFFNLVDSLRRADPQLFQSQEVGWSGVVGYYLACGGEGYTWGDNPSRKIEILHTTCKGGKIPCRVRRGGYQR